MKRALSVGLLLAGLVLLVGSALGPSAAEQLEHRGVGGRGVVEVPASKSPARPVSAALTPAISLPRPHIKLAESQTTSGPDTVVVLASSTYTCTDSVNGSLSTTTFSISNYSSLRRYVFRITNGDQDGTHRINQLSLVLNGHEVMNASDVTTTVSFAVKLAEPVASNTLSITVKGPVNSHIALDMISTPDPSYTLHGPAQYTKTLSPPAGQLWDDVEFTRADTASGPYSLILTNGSGSTHRVTSATVWLNGTQVIAAAECGRLTARVMRQVSLDTLNSYSLALMGAVGSYVTVKFTATDTTAPALTVTRPVSDTTYTDTVGVYVSGVVADEASGTVQVDSLTAHATPDTAGFTDLVSMPVDSTYRITVRAVNSAGFATEIVRTVVRDTQAPSLTVTAPTSPASDSLWIPTVSWADTTDTVVEVDGDTLAFGRSGSFADTLELDMGANGVLFRATDRLGHVQSLKRYVFRRASGEGGGPNATVYPPSLNAAKATPFLDQVSFIYLGDAFGVRQQYDLVPDSLRSDCAAVVRGRVIARDFDGLPNVQVRVLGHDEYGYAITRADGQYDLVVNGGAPLTLRFDKAGYLEAQRRCTPPMNDYVVQDTVALIGKSLTVHTVDLSTQQVIHGRFSNDENGDRSPRVLFQAGTVARIEKASGDTSTLSLIHLRLTEYTVGRDGLKAMPALLPPTTAYTYCVDFTVDEADSIGRIVHPELPAPDVLFSKPVLLFLPNFLNYTVGTAIPNGFYERRVGRWVAASDGRVVQLMADSAGSPALDTNGDGLPDSTRWLDSLGVTSSELGVLAANYHTGTVLWRMPVERFSNADCNLNMAPLPLFPIPGVVPKTEPITPDPCNEPGSIIDCDDRILGETIPVTGTPYTLNYRSSRAVGDGIMRTVRVPVVGSVLPDSQPARVIVQLAVAGRLYEASVAGPLTLSTEPVTIAWDGLDAYGRRVDGAVSAQVSVGYEYRVAVAGGMGMRSFGDPGASVSAIDLATGARQVGQVIWNRQTISLGSPSTGCDGLGGWTLSAHHTYDGHGLGAVYCGDGTYMPLRGRTLHRYSKRLQSVCQTSDVGSVGELAVTPSRLAYGPNGALYIADDCRKAILRVDRMGHVTRVAGMNQAGPYAGDGPATATALPYSITGLAVSDDGTLYIASSDSASPGHSLLCSVTPDGAIRKIAGGKPNAVRGGGDGGPVSAAWLGHVSALALGPDGSLFIGECNGAPRDDHRVRRIGTNGVITTYAGAGGTGTSDSSGRATSIRLGLPTDLEVDAQGAVYIAEATRGIRVRRVAPNGMMTMYVDGFVPEGTPFTGPYTRSQVLDMTLAPDGAMYLLTCEDWYQFLNYYLLLRREPDGTVVSKSALHGSVGLSQVITMTDQDDMPTESIDLYLVQALACDPEGTLALGGCLSLWRETGAAGAESEGLVGVPSASGDEVYVFAAKGDSAGRHLYTRDAWTGCVRYRFGYDAAGRLATIRDAAGLTTTIGRDGAGAPLWIEGPFGHRTTLTLDANGHLETVAGPGVRPFELATSPDGLLQTLADPLGNLHTFSYGADGRLTMDEAPAETGIRQTLSAPTYSGMRRTVLRTTAEGRTTAHSVTNLWNGTRQREIVDPAGLSTFRTDSANGMTRLVFADGMIVVDSAVADRRFGLTVPLVKLSRERLPSGLTRTVGRTRSTSSYLGFDPPRVKGSWTEEVSVNSETASKLTFNADSLLWRMVTSVGRVYTVAVDTAGRPLRVSAPGLADQTSEYDALGRLRRVRQGGRGYSIGYDALGRMATIRDTLGRMMSASYLDDDRPAGLVLPGGRTVGLSYDENRNLRSIVPPGRPAHSFDYDGVDALTSYASPGAGETDSLTQYVYDHDGLLARLDKPGGEAATFRYGVSTGRLDSVTIDRGGVALGYLGTGQLATVTSPDSVILSYGYDGPIDTVQIWSGRVGGSVSVALDRDFRVASRRVNGANTVAYSYDADGLMTRAGDLAISRRLDNGLVSATTLGNISTTESYSHVGELWKRTVVCGGTSLYEATYGRDSLGRIVGIVETVQGTQRTYGYAYGSPDTGFVSAVTVDGVAEHYRYDGNGNRLAYSGPADTSTATCDAQDRLLRYGSTHYVYTPAGELAVAASGADTTHYTYDALGNLVKVRFPGGDSLEYLVDGLSRRVARKWNGAVTRQWLYEDQLRPVAELDSAGSVVARYVYGVAMNVPEYMVKGGSTYRIVSDHLGSVRLVVDVATGSVAQRMRYDVYGRLLEDTNPGFQCFGFAGGLWDQTTGAVRFGARDYDPSVGRWTCKDPVRFLGGSTNLYDYVLSGPVNRIDNEGTWPKATDPFYGFDDPAFRDWFHREWLPENPGPRVRPPEEVEEAYRQFCEEKGKTPWKRGPRGGVPPGWYQFFPPIPVWIPLDGYFPSPDLRRPVRV